MNYQNPGNLLPFYLDLNWQRHRMVGQDALPYGLPASRTRLIPFQAYLPDTANQLALVFRLQNAETGEVLTLSNDLLEISCKAGGSFWVTFKGEYLDVVPDCGFWFILLSFSTESDVYVLYSEVLRLSNWANFEKARLTITSCDENGANVEFFLSVTSALVGTATDVLLQKRTGASWSGIGTGDTLFAAPTADETATIRITVTSDTGNVLQTEYTLSWTAGDPCNTLSMEETGNGDVFALDLPALWRLTFTNENDRGNVLYQTGYVQELYIEPAPVLDVPEMERQVETVVNGEGKAIIRFARTTERLKFEVMDLPDYAILFLTASGTLGTVTLENITNAQAVELENMAFTSRRQGKELNTGQFQADGRVDLFSGCDEDFELEACP